ncbi:class II fumarate hydratase [Sandaracinobacteroides sp. A072]|uniref:class II fumarate hydratase n=1 Tax=Sandaracinobacteroides sp. A072 TaxID=3461146 RepID=UPI004042F3D3
MRIEKDSLGTIEVPDDAFWGAQTQRSIANFPIGNERMPIAVIHALALVKQAAAIIHKRSGALPAVRADAIIAAAAEVAAGRHDTHFPLVVWQTGSGTQSNMNVNEVIAGIANERLAGTRGGKAPVHPNDDVNRAQSSNDSFPTAMHIAATLMVKRRLLPALSALAAAFEARALEWAGLVKIGRTHLQDATPVTLGQEMSAYARQLRDGIARVQGVLPRLHRLAQGGTAVGTGLNAPANFAADMAAELSELTGEPFEPAPNLFEALQSNDTMVELAGVLATVAASFNKIANDIRLMASGPRSGLGEINLPENEPGSSIMPGKVNPTQCEMMTMVAARVMGNQVTVAFAGAQGQLELNVMKPVIADAVLQSLQLLADAADSFRLRCVDGMTANPARLAELLERSLMLVTALVPEIGYDKAAEMARKAHADGTTLLEAGLALGHVTEAQFRRLVKPETMV